MQKIASISIIITMILMSIFIIYIQFQTSRYIIPGIKRVIKKVDNLLDGGMSGVNDLIDRVGDGVGDGVDNIEPVDDIGDEDRKLYDISARIPEL